MGTHRASISGVLNLFSGIPATSLCAKKWTITN